MAEERHLRLSDIVTMTGATAVELMEMLPPPSQVFIGDDAVCVWESSEVRAALDEAEKQGRLLPNKSARRDRPGPTVPDLRQERNELRREARALRGEVRHYEETLRTLRIQIQAAEDYLRDHDVDRYREALDVSIKRGTSAYWPWQPPASVPGRLQGVYRLMREGETVYIGQSVDIMGRIASHMAKKRDFDQFAYALVDGDRETLNEVESALIIVERPPWNHGIDGKLRHPTGHGWTHEEALAILDKYRSRAVANAA